MKRLALPLVFALLLTACGGSYGVTFDVDIRPDATDRATELTLAAKRVIERRLTRHQTDLLDFSVGDNTITVAVSNKEGLEALVAEMTEPLNFAVMRQVEEMADGDLEIKGQGIFRATGITGEHVSWVEGTTDGPTGIGVVGIEFTEEGAASLQQVFDEFNGQDFGIFIRSQLAAKITIDAGQMNDRYIVISGIPTGQLAAVFADDVNTGIHLTFTPQ